MNKEGFGRIGRNIFRGALVTTGLIAGGEKALEAEDLPQNLNNDKIFEYQYDESNNELKNNQKKPTADFNSFVSPKEKISSDTLLNPERLTGPDNLPDKMYETKDGNRRYYNNPSENSLQKGSVEYMVCATVSPFNDLRQMEIETKVPENLTETDFFTNYINTKIKSDSVLVDKNTGNQYFDYSADTSIGAVPFEGDKHWNIQRFLIEPHFNNFDIAKDQARQNTLYDMYKYFLYTEHGSRELAWEKANKFVEKEVDPIINSKYFKWAKENYQKLNWRAGGADYRYKNADHALYSANDKTDLPDVILEYNNKVLSGEISGAPYSKKEIEDILIDYNINYRKKDPETAKRIAEISVNSAETKYREQEEYYRNKPIIESKIIKEPQYPPGYETWPADEQDFWRMDPKNKDLVGEFQSEFTEQDREYWTNYFKNYRFID